MNWTKEKPSADGIYWFKSPEPHYDYDLAVIELENLHINTLGSDIECDVNELLKDWPDVEFLGPISPDVYIELEKHKKLSVQRGYRMQVMFEAGRFNDTFDDDVWDWFDDDGVPLDK